MSALSFVAAQDPDDEDEEEQEDQEAIARQSRGQASRNGSRVQIQRHSKNALVSKGKSCRTKGVLLYSEFAGCAKAMKGALVLNPYDVAKVGAAIKLALNMGSKQRTIRYLQLLTYVNTFTATNWGKRGCAPRIFLCNIIRVSLRQDHKSKFANPRLSSVKTPTAHLFFAGVLADPLTLPVLSRPSKR